MSHSSFDDDALLAAVRRGSDAAFATLYRRHAPRAYAVALRMLGWRRPDADDVTQTAWLRAVAGLGSFRRESSFATWLTGIVIRCALEHQRAWPAPAESVDGPDGLPAMPDLALDLERAIAALAPGFRAVLVLHDVEGFTHAQIATLLDIDEGTSKSQLSRARRHVRERLRPALQETAR